jgi:hypothetical protein
MNIRIVEILDRSTQGVTRPFICRGDDSQLYYVKGRFAGHRALICEWIAGQIGMRLGLPIPDYRLAAVPETLIAFTARDDLSDLGAGTAFASQQIANADELTYIYIDQLDLTLRAAVLLFDWWTLNGDRTLSEYGGNPNILWVHHTHRPYFIDHNMAFDESSVADFWSHHIFAAARSVWTADFRRTTEPRMHAALSDLERWWRELPVEWTEIDTGLTLNSLKKMLWRFETEPASFWGPL